MKPQAAKSRKRDWSRPFRNSGVAYKPKRTKKELQIQLMVCRYLRKNYPHVIFHSDYAANADMSIHQIKINSALQSRHKFPDLVIFEPGRSYVGLALELKTEGTSVILKVGPNKGKLTSDEHIRAQAEVLRKLNNQGWYANFAVGYDAAINIIEWYFENQQTELF